MAIKWLAPECIERRIFTHKSDVWAFGKSNSMRLPLPRTIGCCALRARAQYGYVYAGNAVRVCAGVTQWEIYTYGAKPYEEVRAKDMQAFLAQGRRLDQPSICTVDVFSVVVLCWLHESASRPNFRELVERFARFFRDPPKYFWVEVTPPTVVQLSVPPLTYCIVLMYSYV